MCRRMSDPGMGPYPPRVRRDLEPHPISDQPMGSGFLHCAGRCRSEVSPFSSPVGRGVAEVIWRDS